MICYRDMTYYPYYTDCAQGDSCHRALTQEVMDAAEKMELPICQFAERPKCFEKVTDDRTQS